MERVMAASSKRTYASMPCLSGLLLALWALLTHASTSNSQTLIGESDSVSCGVTVPFSWVLVRTSFCWALQVSLFPQSCGNSIIKSC